MTVIQVDEVSQKKKWRRYLPIGIGILLTVLFLGGIAYFWEEMQDVESLAYGYGYGGGFVAGLLGGITIIPAPSLLVIFALGRVLNPVYVGLIGGLGEAIGGITIYLTGAGGGAMWSKFRAQQQVFYDQPGLETDPQPLAPPKLQSRERSLYDRSVGLMQRRGASFIVFVFAAVVLSPFYLVGLGAGTLGMGLKRFFLISWAGKTVKGLYVAFAGHWGLYFILQWIGA